MKSSIHPKFYPKATITCACGAVYTLGSTQEKISVELCSACHPFFTGKQKILDAARRVEKFNERVGKKSEVSAVQGGKKNKVAKRVARKEALSTETQTSEK